MDRNSAIGFTLIALLLLVYFTFFVGTPEKPAQQPTKSATTQPKADSSANALTLDSVAVAALGDFGSFAQGTEELTTVDTEDLTIKFSNKGGAINSVELKKYKTYYQKPLYLVEPGRTSFSLRTRSDGKDIDLYQLYFKSAQEKKGDSTVVSFTIALADGGTLTQRYTIPAKGYAVQYAISQKGMDSRLDNETLNFEWKSNIAPTEKDLADTRQNTTVTYYTAADGFDELSQRSTSTEIETISTPVNWVSFKQKFFLSSVIALGQPFTAAELTTELPADTATVKHAKAKLSIPKAALASDQARFSYYFGPNDYQLIGDVAVDFKKNVYLGWPPVYWINKFVIFPVFHFLTGVISNYGLIIVILVLLLKLVLFPLSYRSYLSMAKMRVLKPELDEIKEKHGDDMVKAQQDQMKLYQQVGVNPISGCVPVLLQMPILFAMFYLFPASIELRQQPFLWAEDLSTYDSLIRLPFSLPFLGSHISLFTLLMTISTLVYTWQNNQLSSVTGPMKAMSYIMPVIFFFVLNTFSAGLTFYYFVSNLVTFAQQALIRRFVDEDKIKVLLEENRKKIAQGSGKKSKFMTKLEEAMKASEEARRKAEEERKKRKK